MTLIYQYRINSNHFINNVKVLINFAFDNGIIDYEILSKIILYFGMNNEHIEYVQYLYNQLHRVNNNNDDNNNNFILLSNAYFNIIIKYIEGGTERHKVKKLENEILAIYDDLNNKGLSDLFTHNIILNYYSKYGDITNCKIIYKNILNKFGNSIDSKVIRGLEIAHSLLVKASLNNEEIDEAINFINESPYISSLNTLMNSIGSTISTNKEHSLKNVEQSICFILKINNMIKKNSSTNDVTAVSDIVIESGLSSLMSGYLKANKGNLVMKAYHLIYNYNENLPLVDDKSDQSLNKLFSRSINDNDIYGSIRCFNILLASSTDLLDANKMSFKNKLEVSVYVDPIIMFNWIKTLVFIRIEKSTKQKNLFDQYTLVSAIDFFNAADDHQSALLVWKYAIGKVPFLLSNRCVHSILRSFQVAAHLPELIILTESLPLNRIVLDGRQLDEVINAFLRCSNILDAIKYGRKLLDKKETSFELKYTASGIKNILIYFERYWRDYNCDLKKRNLEFEIKELSKLLSQLKIHVSNSQEINFTLQCCYASLLATSFIAGTQNDSFDIINSINEINTASVTSTILELAVYSAIDGAFPLLTKSSQIVLDKLEKPHRGISYLLENIPAKYKLLKEGDKRVVCSLIDIISILENWISDKDIQLAKRIPIGIGIYQGMYVDAVKYKKFAQAARIIKLLEKSRLILDVDQKSLGSLGGLDKNDDSYLFSPTANIQEIRILLARKMTALLLGTSLVTQKKDMIEKIKKNILITKQVQNNDNNI